MAAALAPGAAAEAQQAPTLLSAEARLADYGITQASSVVRGRVSVAHTPRGLRLGVYFLRDTPARGLVSKEAAPAKLSALPAYPEGEAPGAASGGAKALWVWNTRRLLADSLARNDFLAFVYTHGFTRIFLQLAPAPGERVQGGFVPFDVEATGALVGRLSALGAEVDALDGEPRYALAESHRGVLATVARVAEANRRLPPRERFHGVHYDVEPYLVPGYQSPRREEILAGYVALVRAVSEAAHAEGLTAGFDVPFWLDAPDEETGEVPMVTVDGGRASVLDRVVSAADEIAVMDYRTSADGSDGSVAHAAGELAAAAAVGKKVFVAVEAGPLVDEDLYTFRGPPGHGMPEGPGGTWIVLEPLDTAGTADTAGGTNPSTVRVWIVGNEPGRKELAARLSGRRDILYWPAGRPARVPADKQSFHALGAERLKAETDTLSRALSASPAFAGLAYHDYVSLKALLEGGG